MTIIPNDEHESFKDLIDWIEREFIVDTLRKTGGNISQARAMLKIPRASMALKIRRLGINVNNYLTRDCPECGCGQTRLGPTLRNSDKNGYLQCPVCDGYFCRQTLKKWKETRGAESNKKIDDTGEGENPGAYPPVSKGFGGVAKGTPGKPRVV